MKKEKIIKYILILLISILTAFSMLANLDIKNVVVDRTNASMFNYAFLTIVLFKLYGSYYLKKKENNGWYIFLSILFSIFLTVGYSFNKLDNWNLCFSNYQFIIITIIKIISFSFLINVILNYAEKLLLNKKDINISNKLSKMFEEKPFIFSFIVIIVCWLPYIISFYPAILSPDPSYQIKQFFGIETKYMDYTVQYKNPSTITNHHPVLHTVLLGGCVKIGHTLFSSTNIGLFLYSIIQIIILASTLAFTIKYMKTLKTPLYIRLLTLIIYSIVPVFPLYGMSAVKDVIFTSLVIIYMINIYSLIKNNNKLNYKYIIFLIVLMLLIMLMRNNGIYLVIMSFPFLLIVNKNRLKLLFVLIIPIILYSSYNNYLLPYLRISKGSVREMLSIPFQQTARYVKEDYNSLNKYEINTIDKVLDIDTLAERYKPEISDPVKNEFNKDTTKEDLKKYFKVWLKGLIKRPDIYMQATISNIYGYLTPDTANWYVYTNYDYRLNEEKIFNYNFNKLKITRATLKGYALSYPYLPLIGLLVNIGFNVWCYMFMFITLIKRKKYKYLIYITPVISLVLVCFASPVNTYFRYAMPYVFALPIMLAIFKNIVNEKSDSNE